MTALLIIGIVVFIVAFLLMCSVFVHIKYDGDTVSAQVKYLFFKVTFPKDEKQGKKKDGGTGKSPEKDKSTVRRLIDEKGVAAAVSEIAEAVKAILGSIGFCAKHIRVKQFCLGIDVATDDPAKTAVAYGAVCAAVYPTLTFFYTRLKFSEGGTDVSVNSRFDFDKSDIRFEARVKLRLCFAVLALLKVLFVLIRQKVKTALNSKNNETKPNKPSGTEQIREQKLNGEEDL